MALLNRFAYFTKRLTPKWLQNRFDHLLQAFFSNWIFSVLEDKINRRFDHGRFGLKPEHRFLEAHVTVNDELPNRIISGTVVVSIRSY